MNGSLCVNKTSKLQNIQNSTKNSYLSGKPFFEHHLHNLVPQHNSCIGSSSNNLHSSQNKEMLISLTLRTFIPPNKLSGFDVAINSFIVI